MERSDDDSMSGSSEGNSGTDSEGDDSDGSSMGGPDSVDPPGFESPPNSPSPTRDEPEAELQGGSGHVVSKDDEDSTSRSDSHAPPIDSFPEAVPMPDTWNDEDDGSPTTNKETKKAGFFGWGKKKPEEQRETTTEGDNFQDEPINESSQPGAWFGRNESKDIEADPSPDEGVGDQYNDTRDFVDPERPGPEYRGETVVREPWDANSKGTSRWSSIEATKERKIITCLTLVVCCFCWLVMLAIGIVIGMSIGGGDDESTSRNAAVTQRPVTTPSVSPTVAPVVTIEPTTPPSPTKQPSAAPATVKPTASSNRPTASPLPTSSPSESPTTSPSLEPLLEFLIERSFDDGQTLQAQGTPQRSAYEWLQANVGIDDFPDEKILTRYALATFYYSTNGPTTWDPLIQTDGWLTDAEECDWGSTVADICANGTYQSLTLDFVGVSGELPLELGHLGGLTRLSLRNNATSGSTIGGSLPFSLGNLVNMETIRLDKNRIGGSIPTEIGLMTNLGVIVLSDNVVGGEIPSEIGTIRGTLIAFGNNELRGTIPTEIYQLNDLTTLDLRNNFLSGTIASDIGNLKSLNALDLSINDLFGDLPTGTQLGILQRFLSEYFGDSHSFWYDRARTSDKYYHRNQPSQE